jgi:hypothetical protein
LYSANTCINTWLKVMPTKEGERTSVYISHPVPYMDRKL